MGKLTKKNIHNIMFRQFSVIPDTPDDLKQKKILVEEKVSKSIKNL